MALTKGISRLFQINESSNGTPVCLHEDGSVAVHYSLPHIDGELTPIDSIEYCLGQFVKDLEPGIKLRLRSISQITTGFDFPHARTEATHETMAVKNELVLSLEMKRPKILGLLNTLFKAKGSNDSVGKTLSDRLLSATELRALSRLGLTISPINDESEINHLYHPLDRPLVLTSYGLDLGTEVLGLIKLQKLGTHPISILDLALIRESLPLPFEIHFAAEKLTEAEVKFHLSRRSTQESSGRGAVAETKYHDTQNTIEEIELQGAAIFRFELTIMLRRGSEAELRESVSRALLELKRLGDFRLETYGALGAYLATLPGSDFHYTLLEKDAVLGSFAPIIARGDAEIPSTAPGAMAYHREDSSLSMFDAFHDAYESFSTVIIGQPGLGKSVFANTFLRSIVNDPLSRVILVDVKGSHIRTTSKLHGIINNVSLDVASGINPLNQLRKDSSRDEMEIISTFVKQLMLSDGETDLPVKESFQVEELLKAYAATAPKSPSIDGFLRFAKEELPRPEHLARWGSDTLLGNVFAKRDAEDSPSRLTYYNFAQIMTASNKAVATGVLAAVMAAFSFELIKKREEENLYFIADETPFFVQHCFQSFRLLMKNVRKLNGSLVLIAQDHGDLVVNGDASLLINAATKVLFSLDGDRDLYRDRMKLTNHDIETLKQLRGEKGTYSKFLLADGFGSRVGTLRLSKKEYLLATTSAVDQARVKGLMGACPGISEIDAVEIRAALPKNSKVSGGISHDV